MHRRLLVAATVLLAGCSGASAPSTTLQVTTTAEATGSSTTPADGIAEATPSTPAPPESTTDATTITTTTTTTTAVPGGEPSIGIDEIVFAGGPYVVISNRGPGVGSTAGHWICQFPSYYELPAVELQPGEKIAVQLGTDPVPELTDVIATVDVTTPIGDITTADGELGLYSNNTFNSADAIVDYVEWGTSDHARSGVAVAAGIWEAGGFIDVPAEALAIAAQAFPSLGPGDWFAEIGG
jgi:hypothetical protein